MDEFVIKQQNEVISILFFKEIHRCQSAKVAFKDAYSLEGKLWPT